MTFRAAIARREAAASFGGETCSSTLPSGAAAEAFLEGPTPTTAGAVAASVLARSAIVGAGLFLVGERQHLIRNAIAGSLAIETFVLGYLAFKRRAPKT